MKRSDGTTFQQTTPAQIAYIAEQWATKTCVEIAEALGMRKGTVKQHASRARSEKGSGGAQDDSIESERMSSSDSTRRDGQQRSGRCGGQGGSGL